MPLPKPKKDEKEKDWIKRCMSNDAMKKEFSDNDQRLAVCYDKWRDKDKEKKSEEMEELREEIDTSDLNMPKEKITISPSNIERRYITDHELRFSDNGDGNVVTGYAARFNVWSQDLGCFKERIRPGAFKKTIKENDIRALINHNANLIIGRMKNKTLELWEDDKGLGFNVKLPDTTYANDLVVSIKRKDITQNSFGFRTIEDEWSKDGKKRDLIEVQLLDISPVTFPAYTQTNVKVRLHDMGIDYDAMTLALIRAERGIITNSDIDLFRSIMKIFNNYIPVEPEPPTEEIPGHLEEPSTEDDPGHLRQLSEPEIYATQVKMRLANMMIKRHIGGN